MKGEWKDLRITGETRTKNCKRSTKQLENVNRIKRSAFYSHSASLARVNTSRQKFWHGSSAKPPQLQNRMIV